MRALQWGFLFGSVSPGVGFTLLLTCAIACGGGDPERGGLDANSFGRGSASNGGGAASGAGAGGHSGSAGTMFDNTTSGPPDASVATMRDPDAGCGATSVMAEQVVIETEVVTEEEVMEVAPVALYVMLDQSGSMQTGGLWDPAKVALKAFVDDPSSAGVDVALDYFPPLFGQVGECTGVGYDAPAVNIGRLPDHGANIKMSLDSLPMAVGVGTPIEGALRGATSFCQTFQANNAPEKCVAVLVTDGAPFGCNQDSAALAQIAADALTAGVTTFAVGLNGADFNLLDMIATAGGAEDCSDDPARFACDVSGGATQLTDALAKIREVVTTVITHTETVVSVEETPLECEWVIPEPTDGQLFKRDLLNVQLSAPSAADVALGQVLDPADCAERGWHYDHPTTPTRVIACDETCELIQSTPQAKIDILLGCPALLLE